MRKFYTPAEWAILGQIVNATIELENRLTEKGYEVINTFAMRSDNDSIVFVVTNKTSPYVKYLEVCILDVLNNQDKLEKELFAPAEVLLEASPEQMEKEALKKRLAELENNG